MKKIVLFLCTLVGMNVFAAELSEQKKSHRQSYQWTGYLAQVAACAGVHAMGSYLQERTRGLFLGILIGKVYVAQAAKKYISEDIFDFNENDWAQADNNWASFWGWLLQGAASDLKNEDISHMRARSVYLVTL